MAGGFQGPSYPCYSRGMNKDMVNRAVARLNAELAQMAPALSEALSAPIPATTQDPNVTGPCQLQSSPFCEGTGWQRLNPLDMLQADTSFRTYAPACQACYDTNADAYVAALHGTEAGR